MVPFIKGENRIGASRLHRLSDILMVPASFFFEGNPPPSNNLTIASDAPSPAYVDSFLASREGIALASAFMRIPTAKLRHCIVELVEEIEAAERHK